ncbi:MAG: preprotein translocase subunit SecA, partial [Synergistaceae bacterium]|nr:preprotein translocase subunit SecA [Synergistaceae bacterium]
MFKGILKALGLDPNDRLMARYRDAAFEIGNLEQDVRQISDEELTRSAAFFRGRLEEGETLDDIMPEVFARVRETSVRRLGLRHFDEQLMAGMAL